MRELGGFRLEPITAIGQPPTQEANGNGCRQCPPKRQTKIGHQPQEGESRPEDLPLHPIILDSTSKVRSDDSLLLGTHFSQRPGANTEPVGTAHTSLCAAGRTLGRLIWTARDHGRLFDSGSEEFQGFVNGRVATVGNVFRGKDGDCDIRRHAEPIESLPIFR